MSEAGEEVSKENRAQKRRHSRRHSPGIDTPGLRTSAKKAEDGERVIRALEKSKRASDPEQHQDSSQEEAGNTQPGGHGKWSEGGRNGKKHGNFTGEEPWTWRPGQSGNPSGRPKLLSHAYKEFLGLTDESGLSNADKIAMSVGTRAMMTGDVTAAAEIRKATEGDTINVKSQSDAELDAGINERLEKLRQLREQNNAGEPIEGTWAPANKTEAEQ